MGERSKAAPPAVEPSVIADLTELFGPERLAALLKGLGEEIAARLEPPSQTRQDLARDAHALVSVSGTLGFAALSQACVDLEVACLDGSDPAPPLARVLRAGADAKVEIVRLRASLA